MPAKLATRAPACCLSLFGSIPPLCACWTLWTRWDRVCWPSVAWSMCKGQGLHVEASSSYPAQPRARISTWGGMHVTLGGLPGTERGAKCGGVRAGPACWPVAGAGGDIPAGRLWRRRRRPRAAADRGTGAPAPPWRPGARQVCGCRCVFSVWGCSLLVCCPRWWQHSCWQTWAAAAAAARHRSHPQHRRASANRKHPQCKCTVAGMLLNGPAF